jgi:hypothetical protein
VSVLKTPEQIEARVEMATDAFDRQLASGVLSQRDHAAAMSELLLWAEQHYALWRTDHAEA